MDQLTLDQAAARNVSLPGLRVGRHLTIAQRYREWRATEDGRLVFTELVKRALRLRAAGWRHYGAKAIVESIRFDRSIELGRSAGWKCNDHHTAHLAREAMDAVPDLRGFFETRSLRTE